VNEVLAHGLSQIVQYLGATPVLLFLAIMGMGPWAAQIWTSRQEGKRMSKVFDRQDKRFEEVVKMYESNVQLVQAYENVVKNYHDITENLQELVMITTQTQERLVGKIENNRFCPLVRQKTSITIEEERKP
jgi:hypothetical protein